MKPNSHFGVPPVPCGAGEKAPGETKILQSGGVHGTSKSQLTQPESTLPKAVSRALAEIATQMWRARSKMCDPDSGEVRDEMRRVYRHIESTLSALADIGIEIKDHTGREFNYGLPLIVVTSQPTPGIDREQIVETLKPTIFMHDQLLQMGEVIIAVPEEFSTKP